MANASSSVEGRLDAVRARIAAAATRAGRAPDSVRLIAVSKRQPVESIRRAYDHGIRDFGENYVQELMSKAQELRELDDLRWHLIGHLQRNKAKQVAKQAHVIHTLDAPAVAQELARRLAAENRAVQAYIEVNVAQEEQKSGCLEHDLPQLLRQVRELQRIELVGLMTVGPLVATPEQAAPTFVKLRELRDRWAPDLQRLSMGMSTDFELAIEHGATDVRVGTAIFGERG